MTTSLNVEPLGLPVPPAGRPLIVAGPCSAESEDQVRRTAAALAAQGIRIFRAGLWKPRTRPHQFEGVGETGLPWLARVRVETGMLVATEVASAAHVAAVRAHGLDLVWIGARTTASPFAVQELAAALAGSNLPVLVKNPVNSDLELWLGALERLCHLGCCRRGASHRGFTTYGDTRYRNHPQWEIPMELRRRQPQLPILSDPSHIAGSRDLLLELTQEALDLEFDGAMIETHLDPDHAVSDARQQITPAALADLLGRLVLRRRTAAGAPAQQLAEWRQQLERGDTALLELLARRMGLVDRIGQWKKANNVTILQRDHWDETVRRHTAEGRALGLDPALVEAVFHAVHEEAVRRQAQLMGPGA